MNYAKKALGSTLETDAKKPPRVLRSDIKQMDLFGTTSKIIDFIDFHEGKVLVVWSERSSLQRTIRGKTVDAVGIQKAPGVKICDISLYLNGELIAWILGENDGQSYSYEDSDYRGYFVRSCIIAKKAHRNQGLGSAMYVYLARMIAKEFDSPLRSDHRRSEEALGVWRKLENMGLPVTAQKEVSAFSLTKGEVLLLNTLDFRNMA